MGYIMTLNVNLAIEEGKIKGLEEGEKKLLNKW